MMKLLSAYRVLGPVDLKNVRRDDFLAWIVAMPVFAILLYRFGIPPLTEYLIAEIGFDLRPYYALIMSSFVLLAPSMIGMVVGFLILDERDDGVLAALMVTPMSLGSYLSYRTAIPIALGAVITMACYPIAGISPISVGELAAIAVLASCSAPLTSLFLAMFAENKITGFALVKVLNSANFIPILAYFVDVPWQLAAGVIPTYWPAKMLWEAAEGGDILVYGLVGGAVNLGYLAFFIRRFERVLKT